VVTLPRAPEARTYAVHLHYRYEVGDSFHVVDDQVDDKTTTTYRDGTEDGHTDEHTHVHFDGVGTVMAVDARGEVTRVVFDVTKVARNDEALFSGKLDVTRAVKESDAIVLANGAPPSADLMEALKLPLNLRVSTATDDEIFGTSRLQPIGGRWPVRTHLAEAEFVGDNLTGADVSGDVTLAGVRRVAGVDCLDVRISLELTHLELPNLPPGTVIDSGVMMAEASTLLPVTGDASVEERMAMHGKVRLHAAMNGAVAAASVDAKSVKETHFSDRKRARVVGASR
jgi:hypothetical protein